MFASRLRLSRLTVLLFLWVLFWWGSAPAWGSRNPLLKTTEDPNISMTIKADAMTFFDLENKAVFEGNVVVVRGEMTLKSESLEIRFSPKVPRGSGSSTPVGSSFEGREIVMMTAEGDVDVRQGNQRAKAGRAVYRKETGSVELFVHPEAWQGETYLTGTKITLWLDQNRGVVDNGRAVFPPKRDRTGNGTESRTSGKNLHP